MLPMISLRGHGNMKIFTKLPPYYSYQNLQEFLGNEIIDTLEKALRAFASSSGGAACPGATHGQPQGSTSGVRG